MMTGYIRKIDDIFDIALADEQEMLDNGLETIMGEDVDAAYLANAKGVTVNPELAKEYGKDMKFVFTPLCGTGRMLGERALRQAGFTNYEMEPTEAQPNGDFPGLEHPNPEFPEAFVRSIALGKKVGADVLIATDPDADRLGCAVRQPDGEYQLLTGNQIASIMLAYILEAHKQAGTLPKNAAAVKSIVSTNFAAKIAESYGVDMINVLTGFKWIADQIHQYETGKADHTFMFGFEESYGCLVGTHARDKDAIVAVMALCEAAAYYKTKNLTLWDQMIQIYEKYGYYKESQVAITMKGAEGAAKIAEMMDNLRNNTPSKLGDWDVLEARDYKKDECIIMATNEKKSTGLPNSNVLYYALSDNAWCCARPSGTEPKIKFYIGVKGSSLEDASAKEEALKKAVMELVGQ